MVAIVYEAELETEATLPVADQCVFLRGMVRLAELMPPQFCAERHADPKLPNDVWACWQNRRDALHREIALATANGKGSNGHKRDRERRDREIVALYQSGSYSKRAIGRRFNLTHRAVAMIVSA